MLRSIVTIFSFLCSLTTLAQVLPADGISRLKEGNARFVSGKSVHPNQDFNRVKETAHKQTPFATVIGCSDSRVPNEIIFDQGLGDLFIIRTAGQVSSYASWGSIEFAEEILGHKAHCGAWPYPMRSSKCGSQPS